MMNSEQKSKKRRRRIHTVYSNSPSTSCKREMGLCDQGVK